MNEEDVRISPRTGKPVETKFAPKTKRKPRGGNSPVIGMNGYNLNKGDNAKYMAVNIKLYNMPEIDLHNAEQVQQRLTDYFNLYLENDMKPTVAGMALALNGMNSRYLWAITHEGGYTGGDRYKPALPNDVTLVIKKAYNIMENLWESYMNSGKINPVAGIFLGKNNYGYQDKTEYVLTPNQQQEEYSAEEIRKRYMLDDKGGESDDNQPN